LTVEVNPVAARDAPPPNLAAPPATVMADASAFQKWWDARDDAQADALIKASVCSVQHRVPFEFVVVPDGQPALELIDDEKLRAEVERSFLIMPAQVQQGVLRPLINCNAPPVNVSVRVFARVGRREWELGHLMCRAGRSSSWSQGFFPVVADAAPSTIDLIFRPDVRAAENTLDILSCWNREIVFKDVAVEDPSKQDR